MSYVPEHFACWFEIPVTDLEAGMTFYSAVFDMALSVSNDGPNPIAFFPVADENKGISGHLYPGTPSEHGSTIHLVVPDTLDAARERIVAAGGKVESPDIPVPAGHFFYARDPDGNSIGLFQPSA